MPDSLTDVSTFQDPIIAPEDGDDLDAASVIQSLQGLANRTRRHENMLMKVFGLPNGLILDGDLLVNTNATVSGGLTVAGGINSGYVPGPITRGHPLVASLATDFEFQYAVNFGYKQTSVGTGGALVIPIEPPGSTCTLEAVSLHLTGGAGGAHAGMPATKPQFQILRRRTDGTLSGNVGSTAIDSSASTFAYEQPHSINLSGLAQSLDSNQWSYWLVFNGEWGTNAIANAVLVTNLRCTWSHILLG